MKFKAQVLWPSIIVESFMSNFCSSVGCGEEREHNLISSPVSTFSTRSALHYDHHIECVHLASSNSQIQNKRATKGFILIRHKRYQSYTCLQLSSSIASFVWKPAHFELPSYGGAWHNTKIAFVKIYKLISWYLAILGVKVSGKVLF